MAADLHYRFGDEGVQEFLADYVLQRGSSSTTPPNTWRMANAEPEPAPAEPEPEVEGAVGEVEGAVGEEEEVVGEEEEAVGEEEEAVRAAPNVSYLHLWLV